MSNPVRIWRYEVDEVWGIGVGTVKVGDVLIDRWHSDRCWHIYNFKDGTEGGWHARLLGEASPEQAEQVRAKWAAQRAARASA